MFFAFERQECINKKSIKRFYKKFGIDIEIESDAQSINIKVLSGYSGKDNSGFNINIETLNDEDKTIFLRKLTEKNNLSTNSRINKKLTNRLNKCNYLGTIHIYGEMNRLSVDIFCLYLCKKAGNVIGIFEASECSGYECQKEYFMNRCDEAIILNRIYIGLKKYRKKQTNLRYVRGAYIRQISFLFYYSVYEPTYDPGFARLDTRFFIVDHNRKVIVNII